jgi:hypothetical protein
MTANENVLHQFYMHSPMQTQKKMSEYYASSFSRSSIWLLQDRDVLKCGKCCCNNSKGKLKIEYR